MYAEGRQVAASAVCKAAGDIVVDVPLLHGNNRLTVRAFDDRGFASNPAVVDVASAAPAARRPDLWVVAAGVSKYPNLGPEYQLDAAADDAKAIASAFAAQAGPDKLFAKATAVTLLDPQVTVAALEKALAPLAAMQPEDVAVVFLSGHGVKPTEEADMVFLTSATQNSKESFAREGIGWAKLGELVAASRGRLIVLLDACHSGHVTREVVTPNAALATSLVRSKRAGAFVFAASKGRQESFELGASAPGGKAATPGTKALEGSATNVPHAFFAAAILKSLETRATDRDADGVIELSELVEDVVARVSRASEGRQTPWAPRREIFGDFAIARAAK